MRKFIGRVLLSVLLLLSQQGAMLHEHAHLAASQAAAGGDDAHPAPADACSLCLAFSHLASGATSAGTDAALAGMATFAAPTWQGPARPALERAAARNRGPPARA